LILICLVGVVTCSTAAAQEVKYSFEPGIAFSGYKTYKWKNAENAKYPEGLIDIMVRRTADAELAKKGLTRTDNEDADLYVVYQLATMEDANWSAFTVQEAWHGGANSFASIGGATTTSAYIIRRGHLMIDIYDVKQKRRIWEVEATKSLKEKMDLTKVEGNFRKVMAKIFKKYPPKQ
jgi:hypothetical protein